ncbi:dihydrofolate reductase [Ramlibacter ginsenosidimutans]|uniref:Dihydrofolate reductase n=1 Tax=Ramlibacter ginsenosidimutans TaxID=502333 RepID=A0A934TW66_9BURK|nr:dihydrofolate reductase [Ramlibacter ginsenosidimutans]MBK6008574.1 dihydrofolate reductase [Ramlibacter ginsenosidimutans]
MQATTRLGLIYARSRNGVIGKDNAMPWHLPEDLAHFKRTTLGAPVIMGRKTWDSLPPRFRPLPGRRNIVVTRDAQWQAAGAERVASLDEAIACVAGEPQAWITGGAEIFRLALPRAHVAVVTEIEADMEGDVHAPELGDNWREVARERHVAASGLPYSFVTYQNTRPED